MSLAIRLPDATVLLIQSNPYVNVATRVPSTVPTCPTSIALAGFYPGACYIYVSMLINPLHGHTLAQPCSAGVGGDGSFILGSRNMTSLAKAVGGKGVMVKE